MLHGKFWITRLQLFTCNHEEADTRMVLHAILEDTNVVVVSKDTDVLVIMVYAFAKFEPSKEWYLKIDHKKYVDVKSIVNHFGRNICLKLPHIHAITGCDTTSFLHGIGKVKVLKKLENNEDMIYLLDEMGNNSVNFF